MIGRWRIKFKGKPEDGGSIGIYTCSNCQKTACATEFPQYFFGKDGKWHDPNYCPNCGAYMKERDPEQGFSRAEVIMHNMSELIAMHEEYKDDPDVYWWQNEYGGDLTDMIDCHVVFGGDPPCLIDERGIEWEPITGEGRMQKQEACAECKAKWLMGKYE